MKGHKFSYERFGQQSSFVQAHCACGWSDDNYIGCHSIEKARQKHRRHKDREKMAKIAKEIARF